MAANVFAKPIHEVIDDYVAAQCLMWIRGDDVAIPYLVGIPGIAKTAHVLDLCTRMNWNCVHTHFVLRPLEEISGLPQFRDVEAIVSGEKEIFKGTYWTLPDILSKVYEVAANGRPTTWFIDDYHLASPAHMALSYEMFSQDRQLRGYDIPKNVAFILAGNDSAMAGARQQYSAVINRIAKYPVTLDFQQWKKDYAIPRGVNNQVQSFLGQVSYSKWFIGAEAMDKPWPSPRAWTRFGQMLSIIEHNRIPSIDEVLYVSGAHVGDEAGSDFSQYYEIYSKIDVVGVLDGKVAISIPSSMVDRYIYVVASTQELINRTKDRGKLAASLPIYSNILGQMSQIQSEIALTGLKEVALSEKALKIKGLFHAVLETIRATQGPEVEKRLTSDLHLL
jgi:hypothetical protein